MHAIVHGADIQDRDGGAVLMATLFGAPFHSCLSSTRTAATKGRSFRRRRSAQWRRSTLKSSSGPTAPEGSSFYQSAGLLRGLSRGSIAVADWRKTGSVSAERPSHSYGSPQSGSCCESYAFKRDVRGQTLRLASRCFSMARRPDSVSLVSLEASSLELEAACVPSSSNLSVALRPLPSLCGANVFCVG
jgi:hypothetical protein